MRKRRSVRPRPDVAVLRGFARIAAIVLALVVLMSCASAPPAPGAAGPTAPPPQGRAYPWHTDIVATTFWVGEIFDPDAADGSQVVSAYDKDWMRHYGGCDGVVDGGTCTTEPRNVDNGYFPTAMTPRENPFYLDVPFSDLEDATAFAQRGHVVPWADDPGYAGRQGDRAFSYLKNRWVRLTGNGVTCYGQIEDAGPGEYSDANYVFGSADARPRNQRFNGAGMDVSPALNGCLRFAELDGANDRLAWQFVDDVDVPGGPWRRLVTTSAPNL